MRGTNNRQKDVAKMLRQRQKQHQPARHQERNVIPLSPGKKSKFPAKKANG
jgi:hypothetical protein